MKKLFISLCLLASMAVYAGGIFLEKATAQNGASLVRLVNPTPYQVYCYVTYNNGYGIFDFYINPNSTSRWYYEPSGYYEWRCQ